MTHKTDIPTNWSRQVADALAEESDRACVILVASWIDHLLTVKLAREFSKGNSEARNALFAPEGPFAGFSSKIHLAFCAGWIDSDVYHDLHLIRKLRNDFAHSIEARDLHQEPWSTTVSKLRVPKRAYYDWGAHRAAATDSGAVVLFTGDRPPEATEDLKLGKFTFRTGARVLVLVLLANLGLPVDALSEEGPVVLELPEYMRTIPE